MLRKPESGLACLLSRIRKGSASGRWGAGPRSKGVCHRLRADDGALTTFLGGTESRRSGKLGLGRNDCTSQSFPSPETVDSASKLWCVLGCQAASEDGVLMGLRAMRCSEEGRDMTDVVRTNAGRGGGGKSSSAGPSSSADEQKSGSGESRLKGWYMLSSRGLNPSARRWPKSPSTRRKSEGAPMVGRRGRPPTTLPRRSTLPRLDALEAKLRLRSASLVVKVNVDEWLAER